MQSDNDHDAYGNYHGRRTAHVPDNAAVGMADSAPPANPSVDKPWLNPILWVTAAFFPMMFAIVLAVLFTVRVDDVSKAISAPWWAIVGFDQATRSGLVNLIVGMVFGGVIGVWFGTSYGSQRKTELASRQPDPDPTLAPPLRRRTTTTAPDGTITVTELTP